MKKLLLLVTILLSANCFAQFGFTYNPVDSTYTNYGGWSFLNMYVQKDSTPNTDSYFFKSYHKNFHFMNNSIKRNSVFIGSGNFLIIDTVTGKLSSNKYIPFSRIGNKPTTLNGYGITDAYPLTGNPSNFLTSFTEIDPTVSSNVKAITTTNISNWNTAFGWGNHAGLYPLLSGSYTNPSWIVSIPNTKVTYTGNSTQYIGGDGVTRTLPTPIAPTYNYGVSRTINSTSFTPSSTQPYRVTYNVTIACTATIGSSASGKVELQYFNGSTWITVNEIQNSNVVTLAVALNSVNTQSVSVSGEFPANTQLRLVPTVVGTTTITYIRGTEILY